MEEGSETGVRRSEFAGDVLRAFLPAGFRYARQGAGMPLYGVPRAFLPAESLCPPPSIHVRHPPISRCGPSHAHLPFLQPPTPRPPCGHLISAVTGKYKYAPPHGHDFGRLPLAKYASKSSKIFRKHHAPITVCHNPPRIVHMQASYRDLKATEPHFAVNFTIFFALRWRAMIGVFAAAYDETCSKTHPKDDCA